MTIPEEEFLEIEALLLKTIALGCGLFARQHFTEFFCILLTNYFNSYLKGGQSKNRDAPDWFRETIEWLDRNADRNITLEELRKKVCKCPEHIAREFARHAGCTPTDYLLRQKLRKAANLLVASNVPITEMAVMAGFANLSHFCRKFREHYGVSPHNYRKTNRRPNPHF